MSGHRKSTDGTVRRATYAAWNWFAAPFKACEPVAAPVALLPAPVAGVDTEAEKAVKAAPVRSSDWEPVKVAPEIMAQALLSWLQSPEGITGRVRCLELILIWRELCAWNGWLEHNWRDTAKSFRALIGNPDRAWARIEGKSVSVYYIPTAEEMTTAGDRAALRSRRIRKASAQPQAIGPLFASAA